MEKIKNIQMPNGQIYGINGLDGQITNCLLEVPQRINVEIVDGSVVLRAGSVVIVPNGPGIFDYVTVERDVSTGPVGTATNSTFWSYDKNTKTLRQSGGLNGGRSGDTDSLNGADGFWLNTSANRIYNYSAGATVASSLSLPFAIIHRTSGTWDKVEKVFNGRGYIGSTVWVDKDVKGLISNRKNADGTYNNIEWTANETLTYTDNDTDGTSTMYWGYIVEEGALSNAFVGNWSFDKDDNVWRHSTAGVRHALMFGTYKQNATAGRMISDFTIYDQFHVLNSNGDTINGEVVVKTQSNFPMQLQATHIDKDVTPDAAKYCGYDIRDVNNNRLVWLGLVDHPTNGKFIELQTQGGTSGFQFPRCTTAPTTTSTASSRRVNVGVYNYLSGNTICRIESDGFMIQGGYTSASTGEKTITLPRAFKNTAYNVFVTYNGGSRNTNSMSMDEMQVYSKTTTSFKTYDDQAIGKCWFAIGY